MSNFNNTCFDIDECETPDICEHSCTNTAGSFTCSCKQGYQLYGQTHCGDVNECSIHNGGCAHSCINSQGSFHCTCRSGYVLQSNGKDCQRMQRCVDLQSPVNARLKCTQTGSMEYCSVQCLDGAHFATGDRAHTGPFRCGPSTNYTWTQLTQHFGHVIFPACSRGVNTPTVHRQARLVFLADRCRMRRRSVTDFQHDFRQAVMQILRNCDSQCQINDVTVECGSKWKKFIRLAQSTKEDVVSVNFKLTVLSQQTDPGRGQTCDVRCARDQILNQMKRALKSTRKVINQGQLQVSFEGQLYTMARKSLKTSSIQETCGPGFVLVNSNCVACSQGTFYQKLQCVTCPSGSYQNEEGATSCKPCPHGLAGVGLEGAHSPTQCNSLCTPGTYSRTGLRPCVPCQQGTYQPSHGRTTCTPCPPGISTPSAGAASFSDCENRVRCPPGQFFYYDRQICRICPRNKYQGLPGENFCLDCPGNTTTDAPGATNASACKNRQCGGYMGELQGYIESPNWPGDYPSQVECTWNIVPQKGRRILIIVPNIHLAPQDKCADFLVMRKSASPYSQSTFETCETRQAPIAFTARSRKLWIQFKTDSHNSATGFSIPYVTYNEEYQELIEDIVRDGRLYSLHQHQRVLQDRRLLSALLEVIAQPYNYFKYANVSSSMFPESFIKLLTPKVRRFFT